MASVPHVVILGGYGTTGRHLAELLLHETTVTLGLAGRSLDKAQRCAADLNARYPGERVRATRADAANPSSLVSALAGADLLLVASSTTEHTSLVAQAALDAGCDYLDIQYSAEKLRVLEGLRGEITSAGRCFITDGGFHPGVPGALVRAVAPAFDPLTAARVASVIQIDWASLDLVPETMAEFVSEFLGYQALEFRDGRWQAAPMTRMSAFPRFDFGSPFGRRVCFPMPLEEMRHLPERFPKLEACGFYIAGFNPVVDNVFTPIAMLAMRISPRHIAGPAGRFYFWGLRTFSRPPYGTRLRLEAEGLYRDRPARAAITLAHPDGYAFTAIPVVASLLQWLDGDRRPGLWLQAEYVEPLRFLRDLERLGIGVVIEDEASVLGAWETSDIMRS